MAETNPRGPMSLEGVRVLDLSWYIAGPICGKILADNGAEVIKIESEGSLDPIRMAGAWVNGLNTAPDGGLTFTHFNRNKLGATLNLKQPAARDLFIELVKKSDVVLDNYTAGTMEKFGLGYEVLREANPGIVMAELSGLGQTGPYRSYVAFGMTLMALSGAYELTGFLDGTPLMPGYTYPDVAGPFLGAMAIVAALHWRRKTGVGQYLDLAQFQMGASLFAEHQFEVLVNGDERLRQGNYEAGTIVNGVFRCAGDDEWCVVVVRTDDEWDALARVAGLPARLSEGRRSEPLFAQHHRDEIDAQVEGWTMTHTPYEVRDLLQAAGVEAAPVQGIPHMVDLDTHLHARGFYDQVTHMTGEEITMDGMPFKMSATPGQLRSTGPIFGGDNDYVFGELLGLSLSEIERLRKANVIA